MTNPEFETTAWPLVHVRFFGKDDDASIRRLLDGLSHYIARGQCGLVFDTTAIVSAELLDAQRWMRQEGDWMRANKALITANVRVVSFVITSPAIRFMLSGILLISALPCPYLVTQSRTEAQAFCSERLRHAVVTLPKRPRNSSPRSDEES